MNRDIKFRAWVKLENDKQSYAGLYEVEGLDFFNSLVKVERASHFCHKIFRFEEVELMQHTGLKDKNGVEIYEGDIFIINESKPEEVNSVEFDDGEYRLIPHGLSLPEWRLNGEVIGNIYENPEL